MRLLLLSLLLFTSFFAAAQFSLSTDISIMRNNSPRQQFWTAGQTIRGEWYTAAKNGPYLSIGYYLKGTFNNGFTATAKNGTNNPVPLTYVVNSAWQFRQAGLGWKHYFSGRFNEEKKGSIYGSIGTGILFARIENRFSGLVDTGRYQYAGPTRAAGTFRRITLDLGLGGEWPIGADMYAFGELRSWLQASETPSALVAGNRRIPLTTSAHAGLRVLIW